MASEKCSLLDYAISRLRPEVFSHPVWVRFSNKDHVIPPKTIQQLFCESEQLQHDSPGEACQILLICAVHENYAGRHDSALRIIQQALALAERNSLAREMIWATWGACAVCFQENNYEQAARYLEYLQAELSEQTEWVLADFIEVVKQSLLQPGLVSSHEPAGLAHPQPGDELLSLTFNWLRHWGVSYLASGRNFEGNLSRSITDDVPEEKVVHPSFLRSTLSSIRSHLSGRTIGPRTTKNIPELPKASISRAFTKEPGANVLSSKFASTSTRSECSSGEKIITMVVQMLGSFSITIQDVPAKFSVSRGLSLLKYLLFHHKEAISREVLMDIFWPDTEPEASRNNLNVAMYSLRQALRSVTDVAVIHFEDGAYSLASNLNLWLDVEEFEQCIKEGQRFEAQNQSTAAITKYEVALNLYQGDFLADSPYEDWTIPGRERLRLSYLETLDRLSQIYFDQDRYAACIALCQTILNRDRCREDAHYRLMQCYSRLGQGPLALRQYQVCAEALQVELEVDPAPETAQLYERIRHHEPV